MALKAIGGLLALPLLALTATAHAQERATGLSGDRASPQMFGAVGDGVASDTAAVSAWLNSGRPLACTGAFRIEQAVIASVPLGRSLHLQGSGRHACRFILDDSGRIQIDAALPAGSDLSANASHGASQVVIRDVAIEPAYPMPAVAGAAGAAISVRFPGATTGNPGGWTDPMVMIDNLTILPVDTSGPTYPHVGLLLENVSNADVANVTCEGRRGTPPEPGSACLVYEGDGAPVDTVLRNVHAYFLETGIRLAGTWQGVHVSTPTIVATRFGITAESANEESTLLQIGGGEINVSDVGIRVRDTTRTFVHDVHLNLIGPSALADPACIKVAMDGRANPQFSIHDNICETYQGRAAEGSKYSVHLSTARPLGAQRTSGFIHGNLFSNDGGRDRRFVPIHLGAGTSDVVVGCNDYRGGRTEDGTPANVANLNPGTDPRFLNMLACKPERLPPGLSAGGR